MRTSASRVPACVSFDKLYKQFVPLDLNFLPQYVEGTSKVLIVRFSLGLFFGGGEILREINHDGQDHPSDIDGQDQCEHLLNLVTVIEIF